MRAHARPPSADLFFAVINLGEIAKVGERDTIRLQQVAARALGEGRDFGATLRNDAVVFSGTRAMSEVPLGLLIQAHDARAERAFETRSVRLPGVMLHVVLEGPVRVWLGGTPEPIGRIGTEPVRIVLSALDAPIDFRRITRLGDYVRKVSISADWGWLATRGIERADLMQGERLRRIGWRAEPDEIAMAERLIDLDGPDLRGGPAMGRIEREMLAFGLFARALGRVGMPTGGIRQQERDRLARMEAFATRPGTVPALEEIAASGNMSVSSMQRLFRKVHGVSAVAHIRALRLARAAERLREGASVAEAAHAAGYVSPEAFSTAFKRSYGHPPSAQ